MSLLGGVTEMHPSSKDKELRGIGNSILGNSMVLDRKKTYCDLTVVAVSYLVHYATLLQNATDFVIKCKNYFITKCGKCLL